MNKIQGIISQIMGDFSPAIDSWTNHNCPACIHRGQSRPDTRKRGNHMFTSDGSVVYNCYNCHLKAVYSPGSYLSKDMASLLSYFGASDKEIASVREEAKLIAESPEYKDKQLSTKIYQTVQKRELPPDAKSFKEWIADPNVPSEFMEVAASIYQRNPYILDLDLYWSPSKDHYMFKRFIIPYYMGGKLIGYTARHIDKNSKYRYYNNVSTSVFFNIDLLNDEHIKTVLVAEGPIDASLMGGISANNYFLSKNQIELLKRAQEQGKQIVIVPDRDKDGLSTIEQAIQHGFSVALPNFGTVRDAHGIRRIKDFDEACSKYGRLFCLQLIHKSIFTDKFDIQVQMENWL